MLTSKDRAASASGSPESRMYRSRPVEKSTPPKSRGGGVGGEGASGQSRVRGCARARRAAE